MQPTRRVARHPLLVVLILGVALRVLADIVPESLEPLPQIFPAASRSLAMPSRVDACDSCPRLRVVTYNIRHGQGTGGRVDLRRTIETILALDPDVVFLTEVDQYWWRSGLADQPAELAQALMMPYVHYAPALSTRSLLHTFPGVTARYGNLFLSRRPLAGAGASPLPQAGGNEPRNVVWIDLEFLGTTLRIFGTHLSVDPKERTVQLAALGELMAASPHPALAVGDFNSPPARLKDEAPFLWNDPWLEAHAAAGEGDGLTFPSHAPQSRIDYVFVHASLLPALVSSFAVPSPASDHRPVLVELSGALGAAGDGSPPSP